MDRQGITTPRSIPKESRPATASMPATSSSTSPSSSAVVNEPETRTSKSKLPGLNHYTQGINHSSASAPASAPASKSIAPAPISQAAPFKISKNLIKQQNAYYKKLNNDPTVQRVRARIKAAEKAKQNNMNRQRTEALAARKAAEAKQASQSTSSKPFNPSSLQGAPPITKMNKAKAKKLEQIELKVAMGQPLTKNEKAIYQSKGGTRKKTKRSRIQTRKRTKRSTRNKTK